MKENEFRAWLVDTISAESLFPIRKIRNSLKLIERKLDVDLDKEYKKDKGAKLLSLFNYSLEDEKNGLSIPDELNNLNIKTPIDDINQHKRSLYYYFKYLRELEGKTDSYSFDTLSDKQLDSLKKVYDSIISFLYKCTPLPLDNMSTLNDYYGLFLEKKRALTNNAYGDEDDCANLAATQTMIAVENDLYSIVLTLEQEGFFLSNTKIYKELYHYLSYDLQHVLKETDFYDPNEDDDLLFDEDFDEDTECTEDDDETNCKPEIGLMAAMALVCDNAYNPKKDAEDLYSRIKYRSGRRTVATERLNYLLSAFLH